MSFNRRSFYKQIRYKVLMDDLINKKNSQMVSYLWMQAKKFKMQGISRSISRKYFLPLPINSIVE